MDTLNRLIRHPLFKWLIQDDRQPSVRSILIISDTVMLVGVLLVGLGVIRKSPAIDNFTATMAEYGCILGVLLPIMLTISAVTYTAQMIRRVNSFDQLRLMPLSATEMVGILNLRVLHRARLFIAGMVVVLVIMTALFGLQPQWAIRIDEAWSTNRTPWNDIEPTAADYLGHSSFWAMVNLGLCLLLPLGTVIGVFYAVTLRHSEVKTFCAPATMVMVLIVLGGLFALILARTHIADSRIYHPIDAKSVLISVMCCPIPVAALIGGFFYTSVRVYQGREG